MIATTIPRITVRMHIILYFYFPNIRMSI